MRNVQDEVLKFWFDETSPEQWFGKDPAFDDEISIRFDNDYEMAARGIYDGWMDSAKGCLSLIVLLDQFPRNMFRGKAKMFATDPKALEIAQHAVSKEFDKPLNNDEKAFVYLPFEHSETLENQEISLRLFRAMKDEKPVYYDFAKKHYDVIRKFGRFPHRNEILGRQSTKLEEEYLAKPDSGF